MGGAAAEAAVMAEAGVATAVVGVETAAEAEEGTESEHAEDAQEEAGASAVGHQLRRIRIHPCRHSSSCLSPTGFHHPSAHYPIAPWQDTGSL